MQVFLGAILANPAHGLAEIEGDQEAAGDCSTAPIVNPAPPQNPAQMHCPPDLPSRAPLPPPGQTNDLPAIPGTEAKTPLAWRSVAHRLWSVPDGKTPSRCRAQSEFSAPFDKTMSALISALKAEGYEIRQLNQVAGQVVAVQIRFSQSGPTIVFAARQLTRDQTVVRAAFDPDRKIFDSQLFSSIFNRIDRSLRLEQVL